MHVIAHFHNPFIIHNSPEITIIMIIIIRGEMYDPSPDYLLQVETQHIILADPLLKAE